MEAELYGQL